MRGIMWVERQLGITERLRRDENPATPFSGDRRT
jgi:hypothetical protein